MFPKCDARTALKGVGLEVALDVDPTLFTNVPETCHPFSIAFRRFNEVNGAAYHRHREPFFSGNFLGGILFDKPRRQALSNFLDFAIPVGIVRFQKWNGDGALSRTELLLK